MNIDEKTEEQQRQMILDALKNTIENSPDKILDGVKVKRFSDGTVSASVEFVVIFTDPLFYKHEDK